MCAAIIIDGKQISKDLTIALTNQVKFLKSHHNITPGLAVVLVGDDPASHIYIASKIRSADEMGLKIFPYLLDNKTPQNKLVKLIKDLNKNSTVNGILVQLPLPSHLDTQKVINTISYLKDVDGFTVKNVGLLNTWQECLEPSTPQGAMLLIKKFMGNDISGKKAVVLGRSLIVGRPMASMLVRESCTLTLLHSHSLNIEDECKTADILVSAIGQPSFITGNLIKKGACVIDVGITRQGNKVVGDVNMNEVKNVAGFVTPVPGGVGPMTVVCMLSNTIKACFKQNSIINHHV